MTVRSFVVTIPADDQTALLAAGGEVPNFVGTNSILAQGSQYLDVIPPTRTNVPASGGRLVRAHVQTKSGAVALIRRNLTGFNLFSIPVGMPVAIDLDLTDELLAYCFAGAPAEISVLLTGQTASDRAADDLPSVDLLALAVTGDLYARDRTTGAWALELENTTPQTAARATVHVDWDGTGDSDGYGTYFYVPSSLPGNHLCTGTFVFHSDDPEHAGRGYIISLRAFEVDTPADWKQFVVGTVYDGTDGTTTDGPDAKSFDRGQWWRAWLNANDVTGSRAGYADGVIEIDTGAQPIAAGQIARMGSDYLVAQANVGVHLGHPDRGWSLIYDAAALELEPYRVAAVGSRIVLAGLYPGTADAAYTAVSDDYGATWTFHEMTGCPMAWPLGFAYLPGIGLVAVAGLAQTWVGTSADGATWTEQANVASTGTAYALTGTMVDTLADNLPVPAAVVLSSSTGVASGTALVYDSPSDTWTENPTDLAVTTTGLRGLAAGPALYVAVGTNGTNAVATTSTDALTWGLPQTIEAGELTSVVYCRRLGPTGELEGWAAAGVAGLMHTTPDGTTWTADPDGPITADAFGIAQLLECPR